MPALRRLPSDAICFALEWTEFLLDRISVVRNDLTGPHGVFFHYPFTPRPSPFTPGFDRSLHAAWVDRPVRLT
jgi:hypothetical protein